MTETIPAEVVERVARAMLEAMRARLTPFAVPTWDDAAQFSRKGGTLQETLIHDAAAVLTALPPDVLSVLCGKAVAVPIGWLSREEIKDATKYWAQARGGEG